VVETYLKTDYRGLDMIKFTMLSTSLISLMVSGPTVAQVEYDYAAVVESRPIIQTVKISTPQEQCWEEEQIIDRYYSPFGSNTMVLLGTIIGGALGNAVGHSNTNKKVGTVVGAVLGHSIGRDIMRTQQGPYRSDVELIERCETVFQQHEEERIVGYQVTYNYNGQDYTVRMDSDPGAQIQVRVSVQPVL